MTAGLRVIDTGLADARRNVALSAALAELHAAGRIADTLRLHRYHKSVLIGRSQVVEEAVDLGACRRCGAEIARRVTGGGAVAMSPGVLAWDLVASRRRWSTLGEASAALGGAVADVLSEFGIAAAYREPGEVAVAGRKVAGLAGAFEGASLLHQGSLLVDVDVAEMGELLGMPELPVATLAEGAPPMWALSEALAAAFARVLGEPAVRSRLGREEIELADRIGVPELVEA